MNGDDKEEAGGMQPYARLSGDELIQSLVSRARGCRQQAVAARLPVVMDLVLELRARQFTHAQIQAVLTEAGWHLPFNTYISSFRRIKKVRKEAGVNAAQMQTKPVEVERCLHCGEILSDGNVKPSGVDESSQPHSRPSLAGQRPVSFADLFMPREPGKSRWK